MNPWDQYVTDSANVQEIYIVRNVIDFEFHENLAYVDHLNQRLSLLWLKYGSYNILFRHWIENVWLQNFVPPLDRKRMTPKFCYATG